MTGIYTGRIDADAAGQMTTSLAYVGDLAYSTVGGNDTKYALLVNFDGSATLVDTEAGTFVSMIRGLPAPETYGDFVAVATYTQGSDFLILSVGLISDSNYRTALTRITVTPGGDYAEVGLMYGPVTSDGYFPPVQTSAVWDDGDYTAMALVHTHADASISLEMRIFGPGGHVDTTLYSGPAFNASNTSGSGWPQSPNGISFSAIDGGYAITYPEATPGAAGTPLEGWTTYRRRTINPVDATMGEDVFVLDTYTDRPADLIRADNGVTLLYIQGGDRGSEENSGKELVLSAEVYGSTAPGAIEFQPWIDNLGDLGSPWYTPYVWAGLNLGIVSNASTATFGTVSFEVKASVRLKVTGDIAFVPANPTYTSRASVAPYYIAGGQPQAHAEFGISATPVIGVGAFTLTDPWPDPVSVDLGETYRWLPDPAHLSGVVWSSSVGSHDLTMSGTATLDPDHGYLRGDSFVSSAAMIVSEDSWFSTDGLDWNALTCFLVAVMQPPDVEYYGVLGSGAADNVAYPDTPYVGLRYYADGKVVSYSRTQMASFQTATGIARVGQPIILGLSLDATAGTLSTVTCDRSPAYAHNRLIGTHPGTATLYVGNIPGDGAAGAHMEILDLLVWDRAMDDEDLDAVTHRLDSIYGVTLL